MKIRGIVLKVNKKNAFILTRQGNLKKIKIKGETPIVGKEYIGKARGIHLVRGKLNPLKYILILFSIIFIIGGAVFTFNYFRTSSSVILDINSSFEIKCNYLNKVIDISSTDDKGRIILSKLKLKNLKLDAALIKILKQCEKENYINNDFREENKSIAIYISGKNMDISEFKAAAKKDSINIQTNINGGN